MDEHSYEMQDDDAYEGPDADIDDDDEIEYEIDGIEEWAQDGRSVQGLLQSAYQHFFRCLVYIEDLCSTIPNAE